MLNHYIPQWYLQAWTDDNGQLIRYGIRNGKVEEKRKFPKQVGAKEDLYTMHSQPEAVKYKVETEFFKKLDNAAKLVIDKIIKNPAAGINFREGHQLAIFFTSLLIRGPAEIADAKSAMGKDLEERINQNADAVLNFRNERPSDPISYIKENSPNFIEDVAMRILPGALMSSEVVKTFRAMSWFLRQVDGFLPRLITSDLPLIFLAAEASLSNEDRVKQAVAYLPISPTLALLGSLDTDAVKRVAVIPDTQLGQELNSHVARNAEQFVFASNREHSLLVEKHLSKNRASQRMPFSGRMRGS